MSIILPGAMIAALLPSGITATEVRDSEPRFFCNSAVPMLEHESDQFGHWLEYSAQLLCPAPVSYALRLVLQQQVNGGWKTADSRSKNGVGKAPFIDWSTACHDASRTTYRVVIEGAIDGMDINVSGDSHVHDCGG